MTIDQMKDAMLAVSKKYPIKRGCILIQIYEMQSRTPIPWITGRWHRLGDQCYSSLHTV
jgi:hypothetical protein